MEKTFQWLRTAADGTAAAALSQNITVTNASSPRSVSVLTVKESIAGTYTYTCIVRVHVPGDPSLMVSANSTVSVTGEQMLLVAACRHSYINFRSEYKIVVNTISFNFWYAILCSYATNSKTLI